MDKDFFEDFALSGMLVKYATVNTFIVANRETVGSNSNFQCEGSEYANRTNTQVKLKASLIWNQAG